ncbi:hypothetical protein EDD21DRAFT_418004 [Dissophora ornata]|nr:hypothetical protein EDD21DRAFT_418004 [Dissophora ornata]
MVTTASSASSVSPASTSLLAEIPGAIDPQQHLPHRTRLHSIPSEKSSALHHFRKTSNNTHSKHQKRLSPLDLPDFPVSSSTMALSSASSPPPSPASSLSSASISSNTSSSALQPNGSLSRIRRSLNLKVKGRRVGADPDSRPISHSTVQKADVGLPAADSVPPKVAAPQSSIPVHADITVLSTQDPPMMKQSKLKRWQSKGATKLKGWLHISQPTYGHGHVHVHVPAAVQLTSDLNTFDHSTSVAEQLELSKPDQQLPSHSLPSPVEDASAAANALHSPFPTEDTSAASNATHSPFPTEDAFAATNATHSPCTPGEQRRSSLYTYSSQFQSAQEYQTSHRRRRSDFDAYKKQGPGRIPPRSSSLPRSFGPHSSVSSPHFVMLTNTLSQHGESLEVLTIELEHQDPGVILEEEAVEEQLPLSTTEAARNCSGLDSVPLTPRRPSFSSSDMSLSVNIPLTPSSVTVVLDSKQTETVEEQAEKQPRVTTETFRKLTGNVEHAEDITQVPQQMMMDPKSTVLAEQWTGKRLHEETEEQEIEPLSIPTQDTTPVSDRPQQSLRKQHHAMTRKLRGWKRSSCIQSIKRYRRSIRKSPRHGQRSRRGQLDPVLSSFLTTNANDANKEYCDDDGRGRPSSAYCIDLDTSLPMTLRPTAFDDLSSDIEKDSITVNDIYEAELECLAVVALTIVPEKVELALEQSPSSSFSKLLPLTDLAQKDDDDDGHVLKTCNNDHDRSLVTPLRSRGLVIDTLEAMYPSLKSKWYPRSRPSPFPAISFWSSIQEQKYCSG